MNETLLTSLFDWSFRKNIQDCKDPKNFNSAIRKFMLDIATQAHAYESHNMSKLSNDYMEAVIKRRNVVSSENESLAELYSKIDHELLTDKEAHYVAVARCLEVFPECYIIDILLSTMLNHFDGIFVDTDKKYANLKLVEKFIHYFVEENY